MRFRNTAIALILLAGLLGFIYYYEYLGEESRETAEESDKKVLSFENDKVRGIEIHKPDGQLTLRKEADGWTLVAPELPAPARADQEKVDSLLGSLSALRVERTMEGVSGTELEGYKLDEPSARVTLTLGEGEPDLQVSFGDKTPVGGFTYALRKGSPDVLLVSGSLDTVLAADPAVLRYKKIVGVDVWKVVKFSITKGDRVVTLRHGGEGQTEDWRIERPVSFPADSTKVQGLWFDLQSAESEGFEIEQPAPADLERLGLTKPLLVLMVEQKESAPPVSVAFGGGPTGPYYARRSDMGAVMRVRQEIVEKLDKTVSSVDDLRDPRVAPVDRFNLIRIEIKRPGGEVILVKDDSSVWRHGGKDGPEIPSEGVNGLMDALEAARATGFLDDAGPVPAAEPALTLTLTEGSVETPRSLTLRVEVEGSKGAGRRVTSSGTTTVYIVPPDAIKTLLDRAAALEEPK